jgi:hypothetical protein
MLGLCKCVPPKPVVGGWLRLEDHVERGSSDPPRRTRRVAFTNHKSKLTPKPAACATWFGSVSAARRAPSNPPRRTRRCARSFVDSGRRTRHHGKMRVAGGDAPAFVYCEVPKFPFAIPAPSGIGNPVKIPDSKVRITFPRSVRGGGEDI